MNIQALIINPSIKVFLEILATVENSWSPRGFRNSLVVKHNSYLLSATAYGQAKDVVGCRKTEGTS